MNVADRIQPHADQVVSEATSAVEQARLLHYGAGGTEFTRARVQALVDAVIESLRLSSPLRIVEHADEVARDRYLAGFGIDEIQVAFNAVEEALWRLLVGKVPAEELVEDLGRVGAVLGAGKDQLARTYVQLASHHHHPAIDVDELNKGL